MARPQKYGEETKRRTFRLTHESMIGWGAIASIGGVSISEAIERIGRKDAEAIGWLMKYLYAPPEK